MNSRESAALDRWITSGHYHENPVILTCTNGHKWHTIECVEYGGADYKQPDCPECQDGEIASVEPDNDAYDGPDYDVPDSAVDCKEKR
jgi:hypothetical protein